MKKGEVTKRQSAVEDCKSQLYSQLCVSLCVALSHFSTWTKSEAITTVTHTPDFLLICLHTLLVTRRTFWKLLVMLEDLENRREQKAKCKFRALQYWSITCVYHVWCVKARGSETQQSALSVMYACLCDKAWSDGKSFTQVRELLAAFKHLTDRNTFGSSVEYFLDVTGVK